MMATKKKNRKSEDLSELISITEAASLRGVTPQAIDRLLVRGRLEAVEVAGRRLLRRSDVINFKPEVGGRGHKAKS
jgi:excisionase family DNA binding protein